MRIRDEQFLLFTFTCGTSLGLHLLRMALWVGRECVDGGRGGGAYLYILLEFHL